MISLRDWASGKTRRTGLCGAHTCGIPRSVSLPRRSGAGCRPGIILALVAIALLITCPASATVIHPGYAVQDHGTPGVTSPVRTQPIPADAAQISPGTAQGSSGYPYIKVNSNPGWINRSYAFRFMAENVTVAASSSIALYNGAHNGVKYANAPPGTPPAQVAPGYYSAFVSDSRQDPFFASILGNLQASRQQYNLTDDEYLEMMTVFVQSLPYDKNEVANTDNLPRFPVETFVDGTGDCDDKSVLLASLLSREGYDVALLLFIPEHHMAVGIRNSTLAFKNTGYMYVETTGPSLIGEVPSGLAGLSGAGNAGQGGVTATTTASTLTSTPIVIPVGHGTKGFTSAAEMQDIIATQNGIDTKIAAIKSRYGTCSPGNARCNQTIRQQYNGYATTHNYIASHTYEQAGLYDYLHPPVVTPAPVQTTPVQSLPVPSSPVQSVPANVLPGNISPGLPGPDPGLPGEFRDLFRYGWQELGRLFLGPGQSR